MAVKDPAIGYNICMRIIEYLCNECRIWNAIGQKPSYYCPQWVFSISPSDSRFALTGEVPRNNCQHCLCIINLALNSKIQLLQTRQSSLDEELSILFFSWNGSSERQGLRPKRQQKILQRRIFYYYIFLGHISDIALFLISTFISHRRRPPSRRRRRSCASVYNPRPQPSILSENLSRFAVSVCQPSRPLAF